MEIISREQVRHITKPDGTRVGYYIFPEYEIHYNEVPPGTIQTWHHHEVIEESILVIRGSLEARWREDNKERFFRIGEGDLVRVEATPHTFANVASESAIFIVVKLVLQGVNKHAQLKSDKLLDE